jgi:hypothetical protein
MNFLDHLGCLCGGGTLKKPHSQLLQDEDKIRRIPREERDIVVATIDSPLPLDLSGPQLKTELSRSKHDEYKPSLPLESHKTWDIETCSAFIRIGELRDDQDLSRAGVIIGDQALLAGNQLVNSVPIASLCLGPVPSALPKPRGFMFIRVEGPSPIDSKRDIQSSTMNETIRTANLPEKRHGNGVMRAKKRKLEDVLGSFL